MKDEMEKGRALFLKYGGNHGLMHHDGVFDDYRQCGVTDSLEAEWAIALADDLSGEFLKNGLADESFQKLVSVIKTFKLFQSLKALIGLLQSQDKRLDTFTKLLACEQIFFEAVPYLHAEGEITDGDLQNIGEHLQVIATRLSNEACTVAEFYQQGILLPGSLSEDNIKTRIVSIRESLARCLPR